MSEDTISRQAAIEEISKQQTYKMFEGEDTLYLDANDVGSVLASLPSAQPDSKESSVTHKALDTISRQAAINAIENTDCELPPYAWNELTDAIMKVPSAQPEPTLEQIEEYCHKRCLSIVDNALLHKYAQVEIQPEIVRCKDCKYWNDEFAKDKSTCWLPCMSMTTHREWHCGSAERRTDET